MNTESNIFGGVDWEQRSVEDKWLVHKAQIALGQAHIGRMIVLKTKPRITRCEIGKLPWQSRNGFYSGWGNSPKEAYMNMLGVINAFASYKST